MRNIKVLTLYQPWATLLAHGIKLNETRPAATRHRGIYLIHAAKSFNAECRAYANHPDILQYLHQVGYQSPKNLPFGAIVGAFSVLYCESTSNTSLADTLPIRERLLGNYQPGRYAWIGANHRLLVDPLPYRGQRGYYADFEGNYDQLKFL